MRLAAPSVIVYDAGQFATPGAPPLDGALGLDVFAGRAITFQLTRGTLTVESPASPAARVARATASPVRVVRDAEGLALAVNLGVPTPSGTAWMELDSGNSGPTLFIAKYLARQFGLDSAQRAPQPVHFTVGDRVPVRGPARMLDRMAIDGNLGVTFLRGGDVTPDLAAGRAWVALGSRVAGQLYGDRRCVAERSARSRYGRAGATTLLAIATVAERGPLTNQQPPF